MSAFGVREVQRLLHLSRATIRGAITNGLVSPRRGPRRAYQFSFQDVIVLRAVKALNRAKIPSRRISRSIAELKRQLPAEVPLSGLQISAIGNDVIVRQGADLWQADSGQYLLALEVRVAGGVVEFVDRTAAAAPVRSDDLFMQGESLEDVDTPGAIRAYEAAIQLDPGMLAAWINLGRLVHLGGDAPHSEKIYRDALEKCGRDSLLLFNLAVVLEDLGRPGDAIEMYLAAISTDDELADAHFNVARLYEDAGEIQAAIRHMARYRRLTVLGDR